MAKKRILIIDDEEDFLKMMDMRLSNAGYEVYESTDGKNILNTVKKVTPDLILLDVVMPEADGFEVKEKLNRDSHTANIPILFLTARDVVSDKVKGLRLGADDYIGKPFNSEELLARIEGTLKRRGFYEKIAMTDSLTGLYNVRFFKKQMALFFNIAKRYKTPFSLAIIDINDFKAINDTHGHLAGDFVLKKFAALAKETLRQADVVTRYGGDEFGVIMPETEEGQAISAIERLKEKINGNQYFFEDKKVDISFSISVGVTAYNEKFASENEMFDFADRKLYEDKSTKMGGKNLQNKGVDEKF